MKTVLFVLLLFPVITWAQLIKITPEDIQRKHSYLIMRDGSVMRGQIIRQDSSLITVKIKGGDFSFVEADQVVRISANRPTDVVNTNVSLTTPVGYSVFVFRDGTQVEGKYVRRDSTMITVRKRNGQLTYFEPELLVRVDTIRAGQETSDFPASNDRSSLNRFSPWLLLGQTAYSPEKGRFYYRNTLLIINEFDYGITRNWSIGASVNPFFKELEPANSARETIYGANVRFSSKLTFPIGEQFRFGVNATYQPKQKGYYLAIDEQLSLQGLLSFGTSLRNVTLGYGLQLYTGANVYPDKIPFVTVGVMHKLSHGLTFISDNTFYLNPFYLGNSATLSVALRIDRQRHAFDLGALSAIQPYFYYNRPSGNANTKAYFAPYLGYKLIIGRD